MRKQSCAVHVPARCMLLLVLPAALRALAHSSGPAAHARGAGLWRMRPLHRHTWPAGVVPQLMLIMRLMVNATAEKVPSTPITVLMMSFLARSTVARRSLTSCGGW